MKTETPSSPAAPVAGPEDAEDQPLTKRAKPSPKSAAPSASPPSAPETVLTVRQHKKAVLVEGDTYPVKSKLKELGGTWNRTLKGWIFRPADAPALVEALDRDATVVLTDLRETELKRDGSSAAAPPAAVKGEAPPAAKTEAPPAATTVAAGQAALSAGQRVRVARADKAALNGLTGVVESIDGEFATCRVDGVTRTRRFPVSALDPCPAGGADVSAPEDDDDDEEAPLSRRPRAAPAARTARGGAAEEGDDGGDDDGDDDDESAPLSKRAKASKRASPGEQPRDSAAAADDDDDEDDEDAPLSKRAKAPSKKGAAGSSSKAGGKRKRSAADGDKDDSERSEDADDDDDDDADNSSDDEEAEEDGSEAMLLGIRIAKEVLARGERGDHEGVLSALGASLTRESPFESLRSAYRGLARLIHPDKLSRRFPGATKAFQCLAHAFEVLTAPEVSLPSGKKKGANEPTVGRSNHGCYRTKVLCPRCKASWGHKDSGLQSYDYTFLMMGLKTYHCCGCLFEYGCMSAVHLCPHCNKTVAYHPSMYHSKALCSSCDRTYGFRLYTTGPRVEARLRETLLEQQQKRHKQRAAMAGRAQRRPSEMQLPEGQRRIQLERLFVLGLCDQCPRCGDKHVLGCSEGDKAARKAHLRACNDAAAHAAHAAKVCAEEAKRDARVAGRAAQDDIGSVAAWQFLGGSAGSAWMLTDTQLNEQCAQRGLSTDGARAERLARLTDASREQARAAGEEEPPAVSLPSNLHSLSLMQLAELAAANGIAVPEGSGTDELIELLEVHAGTGDVAIEVHGRIGMSAEEAARVVAEAKAEAQAKEEEAALSAGRRVRVARADKAALNGLTGVVESIDGEFATCRIDGVTKTRRFPVSALDVCPAVSLPSNLHSLSLMQLAELAAANGIAVPEGSGTDELIELLEVHAGTGAACKEDDEDEGSDAKVSDSDEDDDDENDE
jgi:hypothetical protein